MTESAMNARVRVPASTSNLGGGFDCVGVAVDRWLTASVVVRESGKHRRVTMNRFGTLANLGHRPEDDLINLSFTMACEARGRPVPKDLDYEVSSTIPVARGLGASAAALIAGAMLANQSLDLGLSRDEIAAFCSSEEGHPDNVGASVFGGAILSIDATDGDARRYSFKSLRIDAGLAFVFAVPDLHIETAAARAILPASLPFATTVAAIAKAAALVQGLDSGDPKLLAFALDDVVHVPYRRKLIPVYDAVVQSAIDAGAFGATLSGSGSTIVALAPIDVASKVGRAMQAGWKARATAVEVIIGEKAVDGANYQP